MHSQQRTFIDNLTWFSQPAIAHTSRLIQRGIERECLRVTSAGKLSQKTHAKELGSALTHAHITTDFAESLLEFITPPTSDINTSLKQLADIHKFTLGQIGQERLWPLSMPCFVGTEDDIKLAEYGTSNVGKMKHTYRVGLKHRYGSMMQVISGVHFNFSLPSEFWQLWCEQNNLPFAQDSISKGYLHLIRNYRRLCWIIPYLFGASPAICQSFLQGRETPYEFKKLGKGTIYLPYATSLRMSDLGYTNSAQDSLNISYNSLTQYISDLRTAINTPSPKYAQIKSGEDGVYHQLNNNVLQIENELYSPIRPKQITQSGEKPSTALDKRGIEYIEVRALDIDPFSPVGVNAHQIHWLDCFLLYCLLLPSADMSAAEYEQTDRNLKRSVLRGREPGLLLEKEAEQISLHDWALEISDDLKGIAEILDKQHAASAYMESIMAQESKILSADKTPSGILLNTLLASDVDNARYGLQLAEEHMEHFAAHEFQIYDTEYFVRMGKESIDAQRKIEAADSCEFSEFLTQYFQYN